VLPDDRFILTTNQFRAAGGGGVIATANSDIVLRSKTNISDALIDALKHPMESIWPSHRPWSFDCNGKVQAM
ncbi:hypothetical protein ACP3WT_28185, partial [Salmonella enterica]|uniref:hypothetical protein n=1 Tax=Salmonella enterica TaxID=28901 RepID=UPI003CF04DC9